MSWVISRTICNRAKLTSEKEGAQYFLSTDKIATGKITKKLDKASSCLVVHEMQIKRKDDIFVKGP